MTSPGPSDGPPASPAAAPVFGFDAFSPKEVAERIEVLGVAKARLPLASTALLAVLAGAYIGFGALFFLCHFNSFSCFNSCILFIYIDL